MYSTLLTAVALFAAPVLRAAAFAVSEPELTSCETAKISWEPTTGPYNVILVDAADPCGEPLAEVGDFTKTFVNWKVNIAPGKVVQISVADSKDEEAWSKNITIKGTDTSCLTDATTTSTGASSETTSTTNSLTGGSTTPGSTDSTDKSGSTGDDGADIKPIGAANAGTNALFNAAPAARSVNGPVLALSAIAALAALAL